MLVLLTLTMLPALQAVQYLAVEGSSNSELE
jgi:hypothetical protein